MPSWYAVAHPGLEDVVCEELAAHGLRPKKQPGGARFTADLATGARLAMTLATPDRLLLEVVSGTARNLDQLVGVVRQGDWRPVIDPQATLEIAVSASRSRIRFAGPTEKKVTWAIGEALKGPRVIDGRRRPRHTQRVQVRIDQDQVTLSVDAGGELLHRRGWRKDVGRAPLRENLAAGLLRLARWSGEEPLLDPFCGSGTIPIEAARMAAGLSPFLGRSFACSEWPGLARWRPPGESAPRPIPTIVGSDRDGKAVASAEDNARRAKVHVRWQVLDVAEVEPPGPTGLVLANPPWGSRLAAGQAEAVYARFGRAMRERFDGWRVVFLAPHPTLARAVDVRVRALATFTSGGIKVGVWEAHPAERDDAGGRPRLEDHGEGAPRPRLSKGRRKGAT